MELKVTVNRYNQDDESELDQGVYINWGGLNTDFGEPTSSVNAADGSITYTFTRGTDTGSYNSNTAFSIDKKYNLAKFMLC